MSTTCPTQKSAGKGVGTSGRSSRLSHTDEKYGQLCRDESVTPRPAHRTTDADTSGTERASIRATPNIAGTSRAVRFWRHVDRSAGTDGCWPWTAAKVRSGSEYGVFRVGDVVRLAHRVSLVMATGVDRPDRVAMHSCDFPPCVNPAHLSWGTTADNVRDAMTRGRRPTATPRRWEKDGQRHCHTCGAVGHNRRTCWERS